MILFFAVLCTALAAAWVVIPLILRPRGVVQKSSPEFERLASVLRALRDVSRQEDPENQAADDHHRSVHKRLAKERDALLRAVAPDKNVTYGLCAKCDQLVNRSESHCRVCGAKQDDTHASRAEEAKAVEQTCSACNQRCAADYAFCPHCGAAMKPES